MALPHTVDIFSVENANNNWPEKRDENEVKSHSYDEALEIIGFGKMHFQILVLSGMVLMAVINETMGISIIIPASQCDLSLTSVDKGILSAVSFMGIILTSHMWGYLADTKGRKNIIIYTLLASNLCTLGSSVATNFITILFFRFLVGVFISAPSAAVYAYLGEFNKTENRTQMISYASVSVGLASMYIAVLGWWILTDDWAFMIFGVFEFKPWRLLLIIYALPGFIAAILLIWFPESPKFLLSQGRDEEALNVLKYIYTKSGYDSDNFIVKKLTSEVDEKHINSTTTKGGWAIAKSMWNQTVPLFKPPYLLQFFVCCALQFGMFMASGGMGLWFPDIVNRISSNNTTDGDGGTICKILDSKIDFSLSPESLFILDDECHDTINTEVFTHTLVLGAIFTVLYLVISVLINPVGRGVILAVCIFTSGASGLLLQWLENPAAILVFFCTYMVLAGICISIVNGAAVSIFPTNLRAMAVCMSLMMGRFGSVTGSNLVGLLMEQNCELTFYLFSGCTFVCGILTFFLPRR